MQEDLIRKIAALLATAESLQESGNEEAAGAYIAKAHHLQAKYSIDQAMLVAATGKSEAETIVSRKIPVPGTHGRRRVELGFAVIRSTDCTGYYSHLGRESYSVTVFGYRSDVDYVETLLNSLNRQLDGALKAATKTKAEYVNGRSFATSFISGFAMAIRRRLDEAKRQAAREAEQAREESLAQVFAAEGEEAYQRVRSTSVALVLAGKQQRVTEEMTARVGKLGKGSNTSATSRSGYHAGADAGRRATISRGAIGGGGSRGSLGR